MSDIFSPPMVEWWSNAANYRATVSPVEIRSILLIKLDHIGDFVLSFDAVLELRRAFPDAAIDLLCAPWNKSLAISLGVFSTVHTFTFFDKRADGSHPIFTSDQCAELPRGHFDLAIDLRVDPDTRVVLRNIDATYKAGFDGFDGIEDLTLVIPHYIPAKAHINIGMHQSLLMLRLAHSVVDVFRQADPVRSILLSNVVEHSDFDLTFAEGRPLVVCNTSSGRAAKNWPFERFRNTLRWLAVDMGVAVLLVGGPDQVDEAQEIMRACNSDHVRSAVAQTSVRQAAGLLSRASLFIGNDSALTHIAARIGMPTVALFSGIDPTVMWAPIGPSVTVLRAPVPCSNCHILSLAACRGEHACMLNITEEVVRAAIRRHLVSAPSFTLRSTTGRTTSSRDDAQFRHWAASTTEQTPQRFSDNLHRYVRLPEALDIGRLRDGFTANNPNNRGDLNRFYSLSLIFDQIVKEGIGGDIAELGVYKGNTAFMLADLARRLGSTAYLLDTFEGFDASDLSGVDRDKQMEFVDTSLEQVRQFVGEANVRYVKGFFPGTAQQIPTDATFSLVHIDCDLYAPFRAALNFFYDRLSPGGFLIMHDYSSLHWDGAELSVDEFFADKPESIMPLPDGSGTVVVRKAKLSSYERNWFSRGRTSGFANAWVSAGGDAAKAFLSSGWCDPEEWGAWGLGASHTISLMLTGTQHGDVELEVVSTVVILPSRPSASVDVCVSGNVLAQWSYTEAQNTTVRRVKVPSDLIRQDGPQAEIKLEFRPSSYESPNDVDPANPDMRPLGLGLIRFRQRQS